MSKVGELVGLAKSVGQYGQGGQGELICSAYLRECEDRVGPHAVEEVDRLVDHVRLEEDEHEDASAAEGHQVDDQAPHDAVADAEVLLTSRALDARLVRLRLG